MKASSLSAILVTLVALGVSSVALADAAPQEAVGAPDAHPRGARVSVAGEVGRYVVGPLGHVRGFLLKDGTAVMLHDTAGDAMARSVPVGQSVRVEGLSPASGGKVIFRPTVYGQHGLVASPPARGERNQGDRSARDERRTELRADLAKLPEVSASGTVQTVLTGRRGAPVGVVLADGTSVFLRPRLIKAIGARGIHVGDRIDSTGKGGSYPLGASVLATTVTFGDGARFEARSRNGSGQGTVGKDT